MHVHMYVGTHMCAGVHVDMKVRGQHWVSPQPLTTLLFETGFHGIWNATMQLDQLASKACPLLSSARTTDVQHHGWVLCGF